MGFVKTASVTTLAVATAENDGFNKSASYDKSAYMDGGRGIDITAALKLIANEYNISSDPSDYIFEAIRGNTTNVPNENSDAFHKNELLRFDHRLGKQVYRTYEFKPHHINHRAENPKNARGFILDAHYNDAAPPLDVCPTKHCGNKTADKAGRDPETGIHCNKCGAVVKDEFVELLVAIDTQKDPTFADGVMRGVLKHGSMGCSCMRTRCNICNNVAYSRGEFCAHIRNKGKVYDDSEPGFSPIAYSIEYTPGSKSASVTQKKTARSFEWCEGVIYDEYSRVHDPADTKAEQYEILKLSSKVAQLESEDKLRNESEILLIQAKIQELETKIEAKIKELQKTAQALPDLDEEIPTPGAPTGGGMEPPLPAPEAGEPKTTINVNINPGQPGEEVSVSTEDSTLEELGGPGETSIEDLSPEEMNLTPAGPGEQLSPADMGIMPPPKRGSKVEKVGGSSMLRFANSYKHLKAEYTDAGNMRVFDDKGTLFVIPQNSLEKVAGKDEEQIKNILMMVAERGLGSIIKRTNAIVGPRIAQVLQYYMDDMLNESRSEPGSVLNENDDDMQDARTQNDTSATDGTPETDAQDKPESKGLVNDALEGRDTDLEDEQHDRSSGDLDATDMHDSDMRDKRKDYSMSTDHSQKDVTLDHKMGEKKQAADKCASCSCGPCECEKKAYNVKAHAARLDKLYQARLAKKVAELEKEKNDFVTGFKDRFAKALKLVANRQALNLEHSPLKTAMGITLCNSKDLGNGYEFQPMDENTAVMLIEAAFNEPVVEGTDKPAWETFIDGLFNRAASVLEWNDETLMQAEADIKNIKPVMVPVAPANNPVDNAELRQKMTAGNLQIHSTGSTEVKASGRTNRETIRQAMGTTKVAGLGSRLVSNS